MRCNVSCLLCLKAHLIQYCQHNSTNRSRNIFVTHSCYSLTKKNYERRSYFGNELNMLVKIGIAIVVSFISVAFAVKTLRYFFKSDNKGEAGPEKRERSLSLFSEEESDNKSGRGNGNEKPRIFVAENLSQVSEAVRLLSACESFRFPFAIGLDCEWIAVMDKNELRQPVSLLQLSTKNIACLFRLCKLKRIPKPLRSFLENSATIFVGVNCGRDVEYLEEDYGVQVKSWLDLRHLYSGRRPNGLAALAKSEAGIHLEKDWVTFSDWNKDVLTPEQQLYAACDAWAGERIFASWWDEDLPDKEIIIKTHLNRHWTQKRIPVTSVGNSRTHKLDHVNEKFSRKKPLYSNCWMYAPDGELLCSCDRRKVDWYIQRELAEVICEDPYSIRLTFELNGRPRPDVGGDFYRQFKQNCCVVCGSQQLYLKHCVVPREYRKYFPEAMKNHQSHDIVLTCINCHGKAKAHMRILKEELAQLCGAPINTQHSKGKMIKYINYCKILLRKGDSIPEQKKRYLEMSVKEFFTLTELSNEILQNIIQNSSLIEDKVEASHGEAVVRYFQRQENGLVKLEEIWRKHFLDTLKPRYLPSAWSVNHNH